MGEFFFWEHALCPESPYDLNLINTEKANEWVFIIARPDSEYAFIWTQFSLKI